MVRLAMDRLRSSGSARAGSVLLGIRLVEGGLTAGAWRGGERCEEGGGACRRGESGEKGWRLHLFLGGCKIGTVGLRGAVWLLIRFW